METKNYEPAFPIVNNGGVLPGMSLRDYFAAKAMAAAIANTGERYNVFEVAEWAYMQADAMIKERGKP